MTKKIEITLTANELEMLQDGLCTLSLNEDFLGVDEAQRNRRRRGVGELLNKIVEIASALD